MEESTFSQELVPVEEVGSTVRVQTEVQAVAVVRAVQVASMAFQDIQAVVQEAALEVVPEVVPGAVPETEHDHSVLAAVLVVPELLDTCDSVLTFLAGRAVQTVGILACLGVRVWNGVPEFPGDRIGSMRYHRTLHYAPHHN